MLIAASVALYLFVGVYFALWADYRDSRGDGDDPIGPANLDEWTAYIILWPVVGLSLAAVRWANARSSR